MARRHTSNFEVLSMAQDPTPGDPDQIRSLADRYRQIGEQAETAARFLKRGGDVEQGRGAAMDALRKQLKSLPQKLQETADSFSSAADALNTYATQLQDAQSRVDQAMDQAVPVAPTAVQVATALPPDATDEQRAAAQAQQNGIHAAQQTLSVARGLADDARSLREQSSQRATQQLDDAAAKAIPERNIFQKIGDFFKDFPFIKILIDALVAIVAVFAPVVGLILAGGLFLAQTIQQALAGQFKLGNFLVGLAALVPGAALLGLGSKVVAKLAPDVLKGISQSGGFVQKVSGSITKVKDSLASSKAVSVAFSSPGGKIVTGTVGEFGHKVGEEAAVKSLNHEKITAGNLLSGAAAGVVFGGGVSAFRGLRGGDFKGGAFAPPPAGTTKHETPSLAPDIKGRAVDQGLEQLQNGAEAGAKAGVAVAEGADPNQAVNDEAGNLLPYTGAPGKKGLIPTKGTPHPGSTTHASPTPPPSPTSPTSPSGSSHTPTPPPSPTSSNGSIHTPTPPPSPTSPTSSSGSSHTPPQSPTPPPSPTSPTSTSGSFHTPPESPASPTGSTFSDASFHTAPDSPVSESPSAG